MYNKLYRNGQLIDLHIHTQYSDGMYSVPELLRFAEARGLDVISFTDHDLLEANFEIRDMHSNGGFCGRIINGSEIACVYKGKKYEVLAYDFDLDTLAKYPVLTYEYQFMLEEKRMESLKEIAMRLGFRFTTGLQFDPVFRTAHKTFFNDLANYPENQKLYAKYGIAKSDNLYRDHVIKPGAIFHCPELIKDTPPIEEVCRRIHEAGGYAIFAHPFKVYEENNVKQLVKDITSLNIVDGFECIHKKFSFSECKWMEKYCNDQHLIVTGGSDFHGDGFKIDGKRFAPEYLGYVQNADLEIRFPISK
ncbi:MAG: PHP domain-containing protein [Clostridia bacterium]|nr:PHP domain-containing protein [Clostridia bacterium]